MMSEVCVRHKLEGVQVELSHLAGCQATDELVQRHHVHSSQLLRCQGVMFGHSLPDWPHLHSRDTLISDATWISRKYSRACVAVCVLSPVTHSSCTGQFPPDCLVRRGVSPGRSLRSPEIYIPSASPHSHSSAPRGQRPADTHSDSKSYLSIYLYKSKKVQNKMCFLNVWLFFKQSRTLFIFSQALSVPFSRGLLFFSSGNNCQWTNHSECLEFALWLVPKDLLYNFMVLWKLLFLYKWLFLESSI